uniref:Uncharacterized protein n=1 Tax=Chelydra serpentina TaxID=8475 RepID=A0A8C3T5Q4_CHESE
MASATPVQEIQEETKCPICLEYLTDPVTIQCGHNFCQVCITQHCETWTEQGSGPLCCPSCRARIQKGALQNNYQLANIVKKIKQLDFKPGKENLCERHGKALDLFCEADGEAVCVVCWRSPEHRSHPVLLLDEAAQKHQEKIQAHLKTLREEREKLLGSKVTGEGETPVAFPVSASFLALLNHLILFLFQQLHQFLEEQERLLLAQLEMLGKEIMKIQNENTTKASEEISLLSELEGKCQKPASEFLQLPLALCWVGCPGQRQLPGRTGLLGSVRNGPSLPQGRALPLTLGFSLSTVNVTLDPDTAHPQLVLSEDRKSVRCGDTRQRLANNPERFDYWACVLGCEGFTSGRHCWEVEVGDGRYWAVGVARESVERKGCIRLSPDGGIWAVQCWWGGQFRALSSPVTPLPRCQAPSRIRISLDCGRGQVTFIDAGDEAPIFTFPPGSVPGERIRPWLWVGPGSRLQLCP